MSKQLTQIFLMRIFSYKLEKDTDTARRASFASEYVCVCVLVILVILVTLGVQSVYNCWITDS